MIRFDASSDFDSEYRQLVLQNPSLRSIVHQRIHWFCKNPRDTRIRDHALRKRLAGKRSFSVTDDIRIIYQKIGKQTVRFLAIGTHARVYNKNTYEKDRAY